MLLDPKLSILFDLAEAGVGESAASVGGAAQVQGARGVPQHCGASWGIRSRLGSLTPESHRYASLAGSPWLNRLAKPDRLRMS